MAHIRRTIGWIPDSTAPGGYARVPAAESRSAAFVTAAGALDRHHDDAVATISSMGGASEVATERIRRIFDAVYDGDASKLQVIFKTFNVHRPSALLVSHESASGRGGAWADEQGNLPQRETLAGDEGAVERFDRRLQMMRPVSDSAGGHNNVANNVYHAADDASDALIAKVGPVYLDFVPLDEDGHPSDSGK